MTFTDALVLPSDVLIIRVSDLPEPVRDEIGEQAAFALTLPRARVPSSMVDEAVAALLAEFRTPATIVEAVLRYSRRLGVDPERTLEDSYPALRRCLAEGYLVPAGSELAHPRDIALAVGERVAGGAVVRCVQVLADTELYQLALDDGRLAALKMRRAPGSAFADGALHREADVLRHLDGTVGPRLLDVGQAGDSGWLSMEWCDGMPVSAVAVALRRSDGAADELVDLCCRITEAYAQLHELGILHGDVHPGNVIVSATGAVRVVDYGLACRTGEATSGPHAPRGGVPAFFEPEYAAAVRAGLPAPSPTPASEQFAVGALLYELLTGEAYRDFSVDRDEMLRQIVQDDPLPFVRRGRRPWPAVEDLLADALAKDPSRRLSSVAELGRRLRAVGPTPAAPATGVARRTIPLTGRTAVELVLDSVLAAASPGGEWFDIGVPAAPLCSIVYGAAGIGAALHRVALLRSDPELLALADVWAVRAARESTAPEAFTSTELDLSESVTGLVTPFHRMSGVHAVQALVSHARDDPLARQLAIDGFVAESRQRCANLDLTLGRSGTLLGAAIVLETVAGARHVKDAALVDLGDQTLAGIWSELDAMPAVTDSTEITYLGMAHGWAGLLLATLRWCQAAGTRCPPGLLDRLDQLAELGRPAGLGVRWSWTNQQAGNPRSTMPGWCNGTAGYVHLWTTAHAVLGDQRWATLAERSAWDVYATRNGVAQLCCGLAGQAYALLCHYRHTGERRWLTAATETSALAATAINDDRPGTSIPGSLHKGDVGVAVLAADLDDPEAAAMPFFGHP